MDDYLLIEQVEKFGLLYNKKDPNFKNKVQRENAWTTIGVILDQPPQACKQRWTVLRNKYNTVRRDMKNVPSGSGGEASVPKWPLFAYLQFLEPFIVSRQTRSSYTGKTATSSKKLWDSLEVIVPSQEMEEDSESMLENASSPDMNSPPLRSPQGVEDELGPSTSKGRPAPEKATRPTLKRKSEEQTEEGGSGRSTPVPLLQKTPRPQKKTTDYVIQSKIANAFEEFTLYLGSKAQVEDEDQLFAKTIALEFKKITNVADKIEVKKNIYSLISNYFENRN